MKRCMAIAVTICLLFSSAVATASPVGADTSDSITITPEETQTTLTYTSTDGKWNFEVEDGYAVITKYLGDESEIKFPALLTYPKVE